MIANYPSNFGHKKEIEFIMERSVVRSLVFVPEILRIFRSLLFQREPNFLCRFNVNSCFSRVISYLNKPATGYI